MGAYINDYVDRADRDLYDGSANSNDWMSSIDLASAVDYYLAMEFLKPVDGQMWASVYMYKPRGEKIHFGPLWDFDMAMGSANRAGNVVSPSGWYLRNPLNVSAKQTEITWFNRMNQNPTFRAAAKARWNQIDQNLDNVVGYVRHQENLIDGSASDNYTKWNHSIEDQPVPGDQEQLARRRRLPRQLARQAVDLHERSARQQRLKPLISRR